MDQATQGFRLSTQQKYLWSLQREHPAHPFRAVCAILLEGELQPRLLEDTLYTLVQRHEILRTTFRRPAGIKTPFQVVAENVHPGWQAVDLTQLDATRQRHRVEQSMVEERTRPLNFERDSLFRVSVLKLSPHRRVMIISLPSLCADAVTLTNIVAELGNIYDALVRGDKQAEAGDDVMQYADFAEWQHELIEDDDEQARLGQAYWKQLADEIAPPVMPLSRSSEVIAGGGSFAPVSLQIPVDPEVCARMEALVLAGESTVSSLVFAAWQAVIWRLTGQANFLIFNLSEGRKLDELQSALGPYATFLPVHGYCEDVPLTELPRVVKNEAAGRDWEEYYEASGTQAVELAFEFAERPALFVTSTLTFSVLQIDVCHQPFKLKLSCVYIEKTLIVELQYDPRVFDSETVVRYAGYWRRQLSALTAAWHFPDSPSLTVGQVDILSLEERRWLLSELNQSEKEFANAGCIQDLFKQQVARTPEAIAVVCGQVQLTYEQLNARANQLAHLLRQSGVAQNDRVGLCVSRSAELIVGMLGILKAGGAYVPLNSEHPAERLNLQLAESNAAALVTDGAGPALEFPGDTINLKLQREQLSAQLQTNPAATTTTENLVYVIYTSGSTGVSKGVAVQHRNLVNYTNYILQRLRVTGPLHFAFVSTVAADLGNTCIFPALLSGGCLHILQSDVAMDGALFKRYFTEHSIDVLKIVPSHFEALLAAEPDRVLLPAKYLLFGGEALSHDLVARVFQLNPDCRLINHYGPTETTVGSLTYDIERSANHSSLTVPIGKPIANTRVYVLDGALQPQPIGVAGELYIGGAGVAAGYLNQAAETAARFIIDPFSVTPGERLYRTGDLARCLPDGNIEFLGRVDTQVKVRGFRVELGEIEAALSAHPLIRQAVVCATVSGAAGALPVAPAQQLVAYIVPAEARAPSADILRDFLKLRLPDYMVPSVFVSLPALPLTANGKVDRKALPAPEDVRPGLQNTYVAPRNDTERELATIWSTVLGAGEVGMNDNFFDLGGHSLLATQVVSRMRQVFQTEIPLASIFQSPTVAGLAAAVDQARAVDTENLLAELEQLSDEEVQQLLRDEELKSKSR